MSGEGEEGGNCEGGVDKKSERGKFKKKKRTEVRKKEKHREKTSKYRSSSACFC